MLTFILTTFGALFSVVNPFATMPMYIGLTNHHNYSEKKKVALKTSLFMFLALTISFLIGKYLMAFFGISMNSLKLTGGMIIATSGFALLSGKFSSHKGIDKRVKDDAFTKEDPSITPLTMPMLAGPGSMSFLISNSESIHGAIPFISVILVILFVAICTYLILRGAPELLGRIGASGLNSLSRFIGFIVIAIGVEYMTSAAKQIFLV